MKVFQYNESRHLYLLLFFYNNDFQFYFFLNFQRVKIYILKLYGNQYKYKIINHKYLIIN